jgi:XTP/dITP diphosphohydrolase
MMILAATNNSNKVKEIENILKENFLSHINISLPSQLGVFSDPTEDSDTLQGNALIKANALFLKTGIDCIADDTGLFVEELKGKPGVHSARFASSKASDSENRTHLLNLMQNKRKRNAYFETVICYKNQTEHFFFYGKCEGEITTEELGENGFGYDPIFVPKGYNQTFAQIDPKVKNKISHRYKAILEFAKWLKNQY